MKVAYCRIFFLKIAVKYRFTNEGIGKSKSTFMIVKLYIHAIIDFNDNLSKINMTFKTQTG